MIYDLCISSRKHMVPVIDKIILTLLPSDELVEVSGGHETLIYKAENRKL